MKIDIQVIHGTIAPAFRQRLRRKINKLESFFSRIIAAEVVLKKDNKSPDKSHLCEIRLVIRGNDLFSKRKDENYEKAVSGAIDTLKRMIDKKKTSREKRRKVK